MGYIWNNTFKACGDCICNNKQLENIFFVFTTHYLCSETCCSSRPGSRMGYIWKNTFKASRRICEVILPLYYKNILF